MMTKRSETKNRNSTSDPEIVSPRGSKSSSRTVPCCVSSGFEGYAFGSLSRPPENIFDLLWRHSFADFVRLQSLKPLSKHIVSVHDVVAIRRDLECGYASDLDRASSWNDFSPIAINWFHESPMIVVRIKGSCAFGSDFLKPAVYSFLSLFCREIASTVKIVITLKNGESDLISSYDEFSSIAINRYLVSALRFDVIRSRFLHHSGLFLVLSDQRCVLGCSAEWSKGSIVLGCSAEWSKGSIVLGYSAECSKGSILLNLYSSFLGFIKFNTRPSVFSVEDKLFTTNLWLQFLLEVHVLDVHGVTFMCCWCGCWDSLNSELKSPTVCNVMDMDEFFRFFAAALASEYVWVMNVIPAQKPLTLDMICDRGFIGVYHEWCGCWNERWCDLSASELLRKYNDASYSLVVSCLAHWFPTDFVQLGDGRIRVYEELKTENLHMPTLVMRIIEGIAVAASVVACFGWFGSILDLLCCSLPRPPEAIPVFQWCSCSR